MTLSKLIELLVKIKECHPEAGDAEIWAVGSKKSVHVKFVGYDKKHKPSRIKLEE